MTWTGQPTPATIEYIGGGKMSDGKSVKVAVPENTTIVAGCFYLLDGFFGCAAGGVITGAGETAEITLALEAAEYETDQIDATKAFNKGNKVYWDNAHTRFSTDAGGNLLAGEVTVAKDTNNVIWFKFYGFALSGVTVPVAAAVADLVPGNAQGVAASLNTGVVGNNNAITWTADKVGEGGEEISVEMIDPGIASQALDVTVTEKKVTVSLATDAGTAASGTSGVEGNNNGLTWTAKEVGVAGDGINVILEDPDGNNQALAIVVDGTTIIVKLKTGVGGAIETTAAEIIAALALPANAAAAALVGAANTGASTGAAAVTDQVVELAGGADPAISSTAALVIAAVNADPEASVLLTAANTGASNGGGVVVAVAETPLAGGVDSEGQQALAKVNELLASLRDAGLLAE